MYIHAFHSMDAENLSVHVSELLKGGYRLQEARSAHSLHHPQGLFEH